MDWQHRHENLVACPGRSDHPHNGSSKPWLHDRISCKFDIVVSVDWSVVGNRLVSDQEKVHDSGAE